MSPFAVLRTYIGRDRQKGASLFLYTYFFMRLAARRDWLETRKSHGVPWLFFMVYSDRKENTLAQLFHRVKM